MMGAVEERQMFRVLRSGSIYSGHSGYLVETSNTGGNASWRHYKLEFPHPPAGWPSATWFAEWEVERANG